MKKTFLQQVVFTCIMLAALHGNAQLKAGFDRSEYADALWLGFYGISDSLVSERAFTLERGKYQRIYRTPDVGLVNRAEIYIREDGVGVLNLRGTVARPESWLENFYGALVPATGSLKLNDSTPFPYQLAGRPDALVHIGWLLGTAYLAKAYKPVLESLLQQGMRQLLIVGHSQGGALSFLTTSYLYYLLHRQYPDLLLKTYASAAPKVGNLFYTYDFDFITRNGFGFRVVNPLDWVPETMVSIQGVNDFNDVNPLTNAKKGFKNQKVLVRMALSHAYNKMSKGSAKAIKRYRKYLGNAVEKQVKKALPQFDPPAYAQSMNYHVAGTPILLPPDEPYQQKFSFDGKNMFIHHMYAPYLYLLNLHYPKP